MKSKSKKIQNLVKAISVLAIPMVMISNNIFATGSFTLQETTVLEKLLYGTIGSAERKIIEHFKSNAILYVSTETELRALAEYVNSGHDCYGKTISLLNDITLSEENWNPIGTKENPFKGTFLGNGCTIDNITYENTKNGTENIGLFGVIDLYSSIEEVNIGMSCYFKDQTYSAKNVGFLVGYAKSGVIYNCTYDGKKIETSSKYPNEDTIEHIGKKENKYTGKMIGYYNEDDALIENEKFSLDKNNKIELENKDSSTTLNMNSSLEVYIDNKKVTDISNMQKIQSNNELIFKYTFDKVLKVKDSSERIGKINPDPDELATYFPKATFNNIVLTPDSIEYTTNNETILTYKYTINSEEKIPENIKEEYIKASEIIKYDFNGDNKVDEDDVSIILKVYHNLIEKDDVNANKDNLDFNKNSKIDSNDATLLLQELRNIEKVINSYTEINLLINSVGNDIFLVFSENNTSTTYTLKDNNTKSLFGLNFVLDSKAPDIVTNVSIENESDSFRYGKGNEIIISISTNEKIKNVAAPELDVYFSKSGLGKYNYQEDTTKGNAQHIDCSIDSLGHVTWTYFYIIADGDEGDLELRFVSGELKDIAGNITELDQKENIIDKREDIKIYADTTAPTVTIETDKTNAITNSSEIMYTFRWSEEVEGFTKEDIILPNGINYGEWIDYASQERSEANQGLENTYTLKVNYDNLVPNGNVQDVTISIKANSVRDKVGFTNAETSNTIRIDRQAPVLLSMDTIGSSQISLCSGEVKEYYKAGDTIKVIATYNENIINENEKLVLQFSESGSAKGTVSSKTIGNKIEYTYTINEEDSGELSVKAYNGVVKDITENETVLAKKELSGTRIYVDNKEPSLEYIKVTTEGGTYKADDEIEFEVKYSEEIYAKEKNREYISWIESSSAPELKIKFGENTEKTVDFVKIDEADKTKLIYSYTIKDGDNGAVSLYSYNKKENYDICDIAGNSVNLEDEDATLDENTVNADTIKPTLNITAEVEESLYTNTNNHYKVGNKIKITVNAIENIKELTKNPSIQIKFGNGEYKTVEGEANYKWDNDKLISFFYEIEDGDNGTLTVSVKEDLYKDIAGNTNIKTEATFNNIIADTVNPNLNINTNTTVSNENGTITVEVKFNEDIYNLVNNQIERLLPQQAPKLVYSFSENNELKSVGATKVEGTTITYKVIKNETESGTFTPVYLSGNLYDTAGNAFFTEKIDTTAPILEKVEIGSNSEYKKCKTGTTVTIKAIFNEEISKDNTNIVLNMKFNGNENEISTNDITSEVEGKEIIYTYIIKDGDKGKLDITDIGGFTDETKEDTTYGKVYDLDGNCRYIYNLGKINPNGTVEADTESPYITNVEAKVGENTIASWTKDGNVFITGRTNSNEVEYILTYSEPIKEFNNEKVSITNAYIKLIEKVKDTENKVSIKVQTTFEGVQSLIIQDSAAIDFAGNKDSLVRFNGVTNDFTEPTIRFISEYNGGIYVLPTNINKVEIRPNVEINEDISTVFYKWNENGEYIELKDISSSSDISIPSQSFTEAGNYTLYVKAIDKAGNATEATKIYQVKSSGIEINCIDEYTNVDLPVTISFGEGLTDNRKVTFTPEGKEGYTLNANATNEKGIEYNISENGIIYAEATDKVGNKVFVNKEISNIDKECPEIQLSIYGGNAVIGTGKDKAEIKTTISATDNKEINNIKYIFTTNEELTINDEIISINNGEEVSTNLAEGTYYLHVIAIDKAGNSNKMISEKFIVENSNVITNEDNSEVKPDEKNIITIKKQDEEDKNNENLYIVNVGSNLNEEFTVEFTNEKGGEIYSDNLIKINKATKVTVSSEDIFGNVVKSELVIEKVKGAILTVLGNKEEWIASDIILEIYSDRELSSLKVNNKNILEDMKFTVIENGEYKIEATDKYGNVIEKTVSVDKIDKTSPTITEVKTEDKAITITASDEQSGISEYAITNTTEKPVEWSKENTIKMVEDGIFYIWVKDNVGNITRWDKTVVVDTTAPVISTTYNSLNIIVGNPIEATISINEKAKISYSWDNINWEKSEEYIKNIKINKDSTAVGKNTLYVKAIDEYNNESNVEKIDFMIVNKIENLQKSEIIFSNLVTIQIDGNKYVKVKPGMTQEELNSLMDSAALQGINPTYKNLTEDSKLKTGTEIQLKDETKYIVVVNGDVNGDGIVGDFIEDILALNRYRIKGTGLTTAQVLAGDVNNDGKIDFIDDIIQINRYRIGIVSTL